MTLPTAPPKTDAAPAGLAFCNPAVTVQSWYVLMPSRKLRKQRPVAIEMLGRKLAVWRTSAGQVQVIDAQCPHLGADLSQGNLVDDCLQCPFHHWRFNGRGECVEAPCEDRLPQRRARCYQTREQHGLIWLFNGTAPPFDLPDFEADDGPEQYRRLVIPSLHLNCHPHLAIANGLDATHLDKLHGLDFREEPQLVQEDTHRLALTLRGRPRSRWVRWASQTSRTDVEARFTAIGSSIAWLTFLRPLRFHTIFTARPDAQGQTDTQTIIYLPKGYRLQAFRAAATLLMVLHADRPVLNAIRFQPHFTRSDHAQVAFARMVNGMDLDS